MTPEQYLVFAAQSPYDAPDAWRGSVAPAPPAKDWAHAAARGVLAELCGRAGIDTALESIDEETRIEIVSTAAAIIRAALFEVIIM